MACLITFCPYASVGVELLLQFDFLFLGNFISWHDYINDNNNYDDDDGILSWL